MRLESKSLTRVSISASRCILSLCLVLSCLDVIKDYYLSLSPRLRVPVSSLVCAPWQYHAFTSTSSSMGGSGEEMEALLMVWASNCGQAAWAFPSLSLLPFSQYVSISTFPCQRKTDYINKVVSRSVRSFKWNHYPCVMLKLRVWMLCSGSSW